MANGRNDVINSASCKLHEPHVAQKLDIHGVHEIAVDLCIFMTDEEERTDFSNVTE
jgi:hypothetical protein